MRRAIERVWETKWTVLLSLVCTMFFLHMAQPHVVGYYNRTAPVIHMQGELVHTDGHSTLIHIYGSKVRECKFIRLNAYYAFKHDGRLVDAFFERVDHRIDGSTKPVGEYDLGYWRIWPTDDASKVLMFVHHECKGETVISKIAEVKVGND